MNTIRERVENFKPSNKHDEYVKEAVLEAVKAAEEGNFGVGAIMVDNKTGEIVLRGRNKVFSDSRSDLHAEMDVMNKFEALYGKNSRKNIGNYTLYTSLECCPMCFARLITSGIKEVYYGAEDEQGGMVHLKDNMPSKWKELMEGRTFEQAKCSKELAVLGEEVFLSTITLDDKINPRDIQQHEKVISKEI